MNQIIEFFLEPYKTASVGNILLEVTAVLFGIASVWFAKKENIWVYPTGIISTAIYVYICFKFVLHEIIRIYHLIQHLPRSQNCEVQNFLHKYSE